MNRVKSGSTGGPSFERLEVRLLLGGYLWSGIDPGGSGTGLGTLQGEKWHDVNGDGGQDVGEPKLEGWRIFADLDEDRQWDEGEPFDITDPDGIYALDLVPGTYTVAEEQQLGWEQTYPTGASPEFQVNTYTLGNQFAPSVAMDTEGDFVVVWQSHEQDGDSFGVYAQMYHADGSANGGEFLVNTTTSGSQYEPVAAMDSEGGFVVVWKTAGYNINARLYYPDGSPRTSEFQANTNSIYHTGGLTAAMSATGEFVVAWENNGADGDGRGVFARLFSPDGSPRSGEFQVNTYTTGYQGFPAAAMDVDGDFVIAWGCAAQDGDGGGIYAQRYDADGWPAGGEFQVNTYTDSIQTDPAVGMDAVGNFVIAWGSFASDGDAYGICARRYNAGGTPKGDEFLVNTYAIGYQRRPSTAMDVDGNFVIAWESYDQDGYEEGVYAQMYDAQGAPVGGEFQVNTYTAENQREPSIAMDAAGNFVMAWRSYDQDGNRLGVFARRFRAFGIGCHRALLREGEVLDSLDFGNVTLGQIGGHKWHDLNGDGAWDEGEPGLGGWTIYLDENEDGQFDPDEPFTMTGVNGDYSFTDLKSGTYTVAEVLPHAWEQSFPNPGPRLTDSASYNVGFTKAVNFEIAGAELIAGEVGDEIAITVEVLWGWMGGPALLPELGSCSVVGDEILIDTYAQWGLGYWFPDEWTQSQTFSVTGLEPGSYAILGSFYEQNLDGPFSLSWSASATMVLESLVGYSIRLAPGEIVENVDFGNRDILPPTVVSTVLNRGAQERSCIRELAIKFSEDVWESLDPADLTLYDETHGEAVDTSAVTVSYHDPTDTATWYLSEVTLEDAYYTLTLSGSGITDMGGNKLDGNGDGVGGDDCTFQFHRLGGDANGDAAVEVADLGIVGAHYGQSGGWWELPGDLNADGTVNIGDLGILGSNYGAVLTPPGGGSGSGIMGVTATGGPEPAEFENTGMNSGMDAGILTGRPMLSTNILPGLTGVGRDRTRILQTVISSDLVITEPTSHEGMFDILGFPKAVGPLTL